LSPSPVPTTPPRLPISFLLHLRLIRLKGGYP
jgi:hypothetical protein